MDSRAAECVNPATAHNVPDTPLEDDTPPPDRVTCAFCSQSLPSKRTLLHHVTRRHLHPPRYRCGGCTYQGSRVSQVIRHWTSHHEGPPRVRDIQHRCHLCTDTFSQKQALRLHAAREHSEHLQCPLCVNHELFLTMEEHKEHFISTHGEERWNSYIGSKYIQTHEQVWKLTKNSETDASYKCWFCKKKAFSTKQLLFFHITQTHLRIFAFECEHCRYKTRLRRHLIRHYVENHPLSQYKSFKNQLTHWDVEIRLARRGKPKKQQILGDVNIEPSVLPMEHVDPSNRVVCEFCGVEFGCSQLEQHMIDVHSTDLTCIECGQICVSTARLRDHLLATHGVEKYKNFLVLKVYELESRVQTQTSIPPCFICQSTNYSRTSKSQLLMHMLTHLDITFLVCTMCPFKTISVTAMRKHTKDKHLEIYVKTWLIQRSGAFTPQIYREKRREIEEITQSPQNTRTLDENACLLEENPGLQFCGGDSQREQCKIPQDLSLQKSFLQNRNPGEQSTEDINISEYVEKGHLCQFCNVYFYSRDRLDVHKTLIHSPKFHCPLCKTTTCADIPELQEHFTLQHRGMPWETHLPSIAQEMNEQVKNIGADRTTGMFQCFVCSLCYVSEHYLQGHVIDKHFKMPRKYFKSAFPELLNTLGDQDTNPESMEICPQNIPSSSVLPENVTVPQKVRKFRKPNILRSQKSRCKEKAEFPSEAMKKHTQIELTSQNLNLASIPNQSMDNRATSESASNMTDFWNTLDRGGMPAPVHAKSPLKKVGFCCPKCNYTKFDIASVQEHLKTEHPAIEPFTFPRNEVFPCEICNVHYSKSDELKNHTSQIHSSNIHCPICKNAAFLNFDDLKTHTSSEHKESLFSENHLGLVCKEIYLKLNYLKPNPFSGLLKCILCQVCVENKSTLFQHIHEAHIANTIKCTLCAFTCIERCTLEEHMHNSHSEANPMKYVCSQNITEDSVTENCLVQKPGKTATTLADESERAAMEKVCYICAKGFLNESSLISHLIQVHCEVSLPYFCPKCDKFFFHQFSMETHWYLSHGLSPVCHSRYPRVHRLLFPRGTLTKYPCRFCNLYLKTQTALRLHEAGVNKHPNIYKCSMCVFVSETPAAVQSHMRVMHAVQDTLQRYSDVGTLSQPDEPTADFTSQGQSSDQDANMVISDPALTYFTQSESTYFTSHGQSSHQDADMVISDPSKFTLTHFTQPEPTDLSVEGQTSDQGPDMVIIELSNDTLTHFTQPDSTEDFANTRIQSSDQSQAEPTVLSNSGNEFTDGSATEIVLNWNEPCGMKHESPDNKITIKEELTQANNVQEIEENDMKEFLVEVEFVKVEEIEQEQIYIKEELI